MNSIINKILDSSTLTVKWEEVWKISEFKKLQTTDQNPYWHSEGTAAVHTQNVVEEIYKLCPLEEGDFLTSVGDGCVRYLKRYILVLAALFHDIGKGVTTKWDEEEQTWKSPYHAKVGEQITRKLLWDENFIHREMICSLVGNHMKPLYVLEKDDPLRMIITLAEEPVSLEWLLILKTADCMGAKMKEYDGWKEKLDKVREIAVEYNCLQAPYSFANEDTRNVYFSNINLSHPMIYIKNITEFNVYILIGIPGSGKTTYRNEIPELPVICRDDIRTEIGIKGEKPMGNKKQEDEVTRIVNERILKYAREKKSFVIDATNLKRMYRDKFKTMLKPYNPKITYIYFEAPTFQDNLERRKGQISKDVINKMRDNFDFPKLSECDKLIIRKQGLEWFETFNWL